MQQNTKQNATNGEQNTNREKESSTGIGPRLADTDQVWRTSAEVVPRSDYRYTTGCFIIESLKWLSEHEKSQELGEGC